MPLFKILDYRRAPEQDTVELDVEFRTGTLGPGDQLVCYGTHHPVPYRVRTTRRDRVKGTLVCEGELLYDDAFVDAVIDTTQKGRPRGFHYEGAAELQT